MTIATEAEVDAQGFAAPLAVLIQPVDADGRFDEDRSGTLVVLEGEGLFAAYSGSEDMSRLKEAFEPASRILGVPVDVLAVRDFDFVGAPRTQWTVDADWDEGEGHFAETVVASCDRIAQVKCAMEMAAVDDGRPDFETGPGLLDHAIACLDSYSIHPPIPRLLLDERVKEMIATVAADAGKGNPLVDGIASFAANSIVGRRGAPESDGDVLVSFSSSDDRLVGDLTLLVPAREFPLERKNGEAFRSEDDALAELLKEAAKSVASRFVDYDSFRNDSAYLDRLDAVAETFTATEIGRIGPMKTFDVFARYDNGGLFEQSFKAVYEDDAALQAGFVMADVDEPGPNGFETLDSALREYEIHVIPLPFDLDEARERLRTLAASDGDFSPAVREVLDEFAAATHAFEQVLEARSSPRPRIDQGVATPSL